MSTLRSLRQTCGLTIIELALRSGIPSRQIALIELGKTSLDPSDAQCLAHVLGVQAEQLVLATVLPTRPGYADKHIGALTSKSVLLVCFMLTLGILLAFSALHAGSRSALARPPMAQDLQARPTLALQRSTAILLPSPTPIIVVPSPQPAALSLVVTPTVPVPAQMQAAPAQGLPCPLLAEPAHIVVTQGYGIGTHAPADIWGGIDLALDASGDGIADPDETRQLVAIASHVGIVHLSPDSWPGGNYVQIINDEQGWVIGYGHLAAFAVSEGEHVAVGTPIGIVGSTGQSSGPHLHYEIWQYGRNLDPAGFISCAYQ